MSATTKTPTILRNWTSQLFQSKEELNDAIKCTTAVLFVILLPLLRSETSVVSALHIVPLISLVAYDVYKHRGKPTQQELLSGDNGLKALLARPSESQKGGPDAGWNVYLDQWVAVGKAEVLVEGAWKFTKENLFDKSGSESPTAKEKKVLAKGLNSFAQGLDQLTDVLNKQLGSDNLSKQLGSDNLPAILNKVAIALRDGADKVKSCDLKKIVSSLCDALDPGKSMRKDLREASAKRRESVQTKAALERVNQLDESMQKQGTGLTWLIGKGTLVFAVVLLTSLFVNFSSSAGKVFLSDLCVAPGVRHI